MPVIRKSDGKAEHIEPADADDAKAEIVHLARSGGLTQFGANVETLHPGARSSNRHWHTAEDEFLYMLEGAAMMIDDEGEHPLTPGDAVTWKAGVPNGHHIRNRSAQPCTFLVVGTRAAQDVCHYPDTGRSLHKSAGQWQLQAADGTLIKEGRA